MSFLFTANLPESKLDRRGRVAAHGYAKLDREGEKYLNGIAKKLEASDVNSVFASDTNAKSAEYIARRMGLPVWTTRKLRGFNFGRFGGHSIQEVSPILESMLGKWNENTTIPIVGGDSWTSYERRFLSEMIKVITAPHSVNVLVLLPAMDHAVWKAFAKGLKDHDLRRNLFFQALVKDKIFKVRMIGESTSSTESTAGRSTRSQHVGRSVSDAPDNAGGAASVDGKSGSAVSSVVS